MFSHVVMVDRKLTVKWTGLVSISFNSINLYLRVSVMHKLVHSGPSHAGLCVSEVEVCHAWEVFRLISHCLWEVTVDYMPQHRMWYTCVCTVFIKFTPLSLTHVGYVQCKQYASP